MVGTQTLLSTSLKQLRMCGRKGHIYSLAGEACQVSHRDKKPTEASRKVKQCSVVLVAILTDVPSNHIARFTHHVERSESEDCPRKYSS